MSRRDNYKTKWLNALSANQITPSQAADKTVEVLDNSSEAQINSSIELAKVHGTLMEAAREAKRTCETMDELSKIGGLDLGESSHGIDGKLGLMNANVMARRIRDVLKMAEARIGLLTVMCEDLTDANGKLEMKAAALGVTSRNFVNSAIETLYIGKNPSPNEIQDYSWDEKTRPNHRFDTPYHDLSDDWLDTRLTTQNRRIETPELASDSDDDSMQIARSAPITRNNQGNARQKKGRMVGDVSL